MSDPIRLAKRLIELIHCSRSEADKYIEGGWVLVDGEIIDQPQFKVLDQTVELHPNATLTAAEPATIILNSPGGFDPGNPTAALKLITAASRASDDSSGIRTLKRHFARLMPTAPLEEGATGLLVFTQDGRIVRKLVKDRDRNEQEYIVTVSGNIVTNGLEQLNRPTRVSGGWPLPAARVSWQNETRLRFALKNPQPGQIETMCKNAGLTVETMIRLRIGRVSMAKLQPGQWRYLPQGQRF